MTRRVSKIAGYRCWGSGSGGVLGNGDPVANIGDEPNEMPPPSLDLGPGVPVQVTVGYYTACARFADGAVKCWGRNSAGQLGIGSTEYIGDEPNEMPPEPVDLGGVAVHVEIKNLHACTLMDDGAVKCWGDGAAGKLGNGNTEDIGDEPGEMPPADVNLGGAALRLEVGFSHTCAVMEDQRVLCWGGGSDGALGIGSQEHIGDQPGEMPPAPAILWP